MRKKVTTTINHSKKEPEVCSVVSMISTKVHDQKKRVNNMDVRTRATKFQQINSHFTHPTAYICTYINAHTHIVAKRLEAIIPNRFLFLDNK